jgi:F-box protein 18 (helicase)
MPAQTTRPDTPAQTATAARDPFAALVNSVRGSRLDPSTARGGLSRGAGKSPSLTSLARDGVALPASPAAPAPAVARNVLKAPAPHESNTAPARMAPIRTSTSQSSAGNAPGGASKHKQVVYSDEQQAVIDCHAQHIVADAFAGCGKTTTAVGFCAARPNQRILYLVLNTANAAEARERFGSNVQAMTTHSLAWNSPGMKAHVGQRLDRRWRALTLMQQFRISTPAEAYQAQRVLQAFFSSTDRDISEKHVVAVAQERNLNPSHAMQAVANARMAWKAMLDPANRCSIPDDAYLKMYALKSPQLPYDTVILDEAQDANPVTAQIIGAQQRARLLFIGDRHQAIYQFRGSVNAMERFSVGADRFALTQTYRFGPAVADIANTILSELKGETHRIKGMGSDGPWDPRRVTYLSRTNAQLFALAAERRGQGMYWVGKVGHDGYVVGRDGPDNYRLDLLADVYHLYARDINSVKDHALKKMGNYEEYQRYGEAAQDGEARVLCKLVETHSHDTLQLIDDIRANAVHGERDADIVVTTAHKSKGLEWGCVRICDDFEFLENLEADLRDHPGEPLSAQKVQDVNLLYVAATRAKTALQLNEETTEWMNDLEMHRAARQRAMLNASNASNASRPRQP